MTQIRVNNIALATFGLVEKHQSQKKEQQKSYGALMHKLPAMILNNGLAHATGFLLAKGREEHTSVLDDLCHAFNQTGYTFENSAEFHKKIIDADLQTTMVLTRHALDIAGVMRRYVQGLLRISTTGDSQYDDELGAKVAEDEST